MVGRTQANLKTETVPLEAGWGMAPWGKCSPQEHKNLSLIQPSHIAIKIATFSVKEDTKVCFEPTFFQLGHTNMMVTVTVLSSAHMLESPGKKGPQLRNHLHQISL